MLNQAVTRHFGAFFHSREQQHFGSNSLLLSYGHTIKVNLIDAYFLVSYIYSLENKKLYWGKFFSTDLEMHIDPHSDPNAWESFFKSIVWIHYKPANCCDLPDSHGGDFGLECYTLDHLVIHISVRA